MRESVELLLGKFGAVGTPPTVIALESSPIGAIAEYDSEKVRVLQAALTLAGLNGNPDDRESGWAVYRAVSSDNLTIEGWTVDLKEGWFSTQRGKLIEEHVGGLRLDDPDSRVPVPLEIRHPEPLNLDSELAAAVLDYLTPSTRATSDLRRKQMSAAIDWFSLAWRNTASVGFAPRIVFLRTAFEALFPGRAPKTAAALKAHFERFAGQADIVLDRTLDELIWSPAEEAVHPSGSGRDDKRTDLLDWFWAFNDVRNRIVHDGETSPSSYDGPAHSYRGDYFWTAERLFREVVRTELAIAGYGDVWMKPEDRAFHRAASAALAERNRNGDV